MNTFVFPAIAVAGRDAGRSSDAQISFFLNVGAIGAQFEGVAAAVYNKARQEWDMKFRRNGSCKTCGTKSGRRRASNASGEPSTA
jgi:hypothetical protein